MSEVSQTPQTPQPPTSGSKNTRRRFFWTAATATLIAGLASAVGVRAFAHAGGPCGWRQSGFMGAMSDPATIDAHLDRMLKHLYVEIDATDAQKQQLAPIVKGAAQDLLPLRAQMQDARRRAVELLSQPTVDRGALEALRAEHVRLIETTSQRLTQALADVADTLTPDQKRQLADRIARWHGARG